MSAPNLIILGPQGSGKTTQAELLSQTLRFVLIGAGDVLRAVAGENTESGRSVRQTVNIEGRLVEPELMTELIKEKVRIVPKDQGLILDGYPRTLRQYGLFKQFWPETGRKGYEVIFIKVPAEEAIKRLINRVTCENCGAVYTEGYTEKCVSCGGHLLKRPDDTPAVIETRLQSFYAETMPMIRAIEADGKVLHIDGTRCIEEVHRTIVTQLSKLFPDLSPVW